MDRVDTVDGLGAVDRVDAVDGLGAVDGAELVDGADAVEGGDLEQMERCGEHLNLIYLACNFPQLTYTGPFQKCPTTNLSSPTMVATASLRAFRWRNSSMT
ncbi:MAG TPA: hypothetical protein VN669_06965 [Candidatus Acidoferrales bacterium]|nr:hypothetical protein [Candidatus Acidoferrales bacterium]